MVSRKQKLLVAVAAGVVLAGIVAILASGSLLGFAVLAIAGSVLVLALRARSSRRSPGSLLGAQIPDDDLETRIAEWVETAGTSLAAGPGLDWDEVYARLDSDPQYEERKGEYENARSASAREEAFGRVLEMVRKQARAVAARAATAAPPDTD